MNLKIGVSACLLGSKCNFNGTDLLSRFIKSLESQSEIIFVPFCPEDFSFGTPRKNLRLVGGDGFDVLDGEAQVINELEENVTAAQIEGAQQFLQRLNSAHVKVAILMDGSPSCGSNVLLKEEHWPRGGFKRGVGVAAALLRRNNIKVLSSFDELMTAQFLKTILPNFIAPEDLRNLKDSPQFKDLYVTDSAED